jgi:hypothetical protein
MSSFVCRRVAFSILCAAVFSCVLAQSALAATVAVGTCTNLAFYPTIQLAVNSVPSGSTIRICPGTYGEQVLITKSLTLVGVGANGLPGATATGANNPVITSPPGGITANISDLAPGADPIYYQIAVVSPVPATPIKVNLEFIAVDGSNNQISGCGMDLVGIYYQNASGGINEVATRNQELSPDLFGCQDGLAIFVESGYGTGGSAVVAIENSSVHDYDKNGITVDGTGTVATVTGNYVVGIGATALIAQNGIQVSDGATGSVKNNTVTDDVYINPDDCGPTPPYCYGSSGILIYDSGATSGSPLAISGNTVSNTQLAIVTYGDSGGTADYNNVASNKITGTQAAGIYFDDGIDLCSNNNVATSNTVFNSSGSGIHIDSTCIEASGSTGNNTTVTKNTINEACAGVLLGTGTGNTVGGTGNVNTSYNVVQVTQAGDSCPSGAPARAKARLKPQPRRR